MSSKIFGPCYPLTVLMSEQWLSIPSRADGTGSSWSPRSGSSGPGCPIMAGQKAVLRTLLWIGMVFMPIQIQISLLMPIQIRIRISIKAIWILPQVLHFRKSRIILFTFGHTFASLQCFIFLVSVKCTISFSTFSFAWN